MPETNLERERPNLGWQVMEWHHSRFEGRVERRPLRSSALAHQICSTMSILLQTVKFEFLGILNFYALVGKLWFFLIYDAVDNFCCSVNF